MYTRDGRWSSWDISRWWRWWWTSKGGSSCLLPSWRRTQWYRGMGYSKVIIARQTKSDERIEVAQDFGVSLHRSLPVVIDTSLVDVLGLGDFLTCRWAVAVVESLCFDSVQVGGVCFVTGGREGAEMV